MKQAQINDHFAIIDENWIHIPQKDRQAYLDILRKHLKGSGSLAQPNCHKVQTNYPFTRSQDTLLLCPYLFLDGMVSKKEIAIHKAFLNYLLVNDQFTPEKKLLILVF